MTAPRIPNPDASPIVGPGGRLSPDWVRYIAALLDYIEALEARIRALES